MDLGVQFERMSFCVQDVFIQRNQVRISEDQIKVFQGLSEKVTITR